MRRHMVRSTCLALAVAAGLSVGVVGCSSSPSKTAMDNRIKTVNTIDDMRGELTKADSQVVVTQESLNRLSTQRAGNLSDTYKDYSGNISKNQSQLEKINNLSGNLTTQSYRQINDWSYQARTIDDPSMRQKSLQEETTARKQQEQMVAALTDVRASYDNYIRELQDISTFASANLTPTGLSDLGKQSQKANEAAEVLRTKFAVLDSKLGTLAQAWQVNVPLASRLEDQKAKPAGATMEPANTPADTPK